MEYHGAVLIARAEPDKQSGPVMPLLLTAAAATTHGSLLEVVLRQPPSAQVHSTSYLENMQTMGGAVLYAETV